MWTPRRILLLLAALTAFAAVYVGYARFLGRIDGLPKLPDKYLEFDMDNPLPALEAVVSPTLVRLREAFGDNCAEMGAVYPTRLEMREQGIVFAAGMPQIGSEPTRFVRLAPLSVATFAKPKPPHEQVPGEVTEVSTMHCDEGILEFDRPISSDRDMLAGKAKLIGIELRSNPDPHTTDPRNGRIVLTNNQRLSDPARFLVMKTPGPVYYRTSDHPEANNPALPHIWTTAAVEIVNRDNLPRPLRGPSLPAVPVAGEETLKGDVVGDMALGLHTAPPTVTADGLKIFMKRGEPEKGKRDAGFSGIRDIYLNENVLFSLWIDGASGFPGGEAKAPAKVIPVEPGIASAALLGGLHDGALTTNRLKTKALLRIRTLGPFRYDVAANAARFDIAAQPNPLLPNNVEVLRYQPLAAKDYLVCQRLEIEFSGRVAGKPDNVKDKNASPGFKRLLATGTHVLVASGSEQLQAQGTALYYVNDVPGKQATTVLRGSPLSAVRGKNVLTAGTMQTPAELSLRSAQPSVPANGQQSDVVINGAGRIDLVDEQTGEKQLTATWQKSLTQQRETLDGLPMDRFDFKGDGEFIDAKGQFKLRGDELKLWLKKGDKTANKASPHRMQALGHVSGLADDAIIENTDYLTMMFADVPKTESKPATGVLVSSPSGPPPILQPVAKAPAEKPKPNPVRMSARQIDVWLNRNLDAENAKYDLHEARCVDRVVVVQAPTDPKKSPVGIDIHGGGLLLKKLANGHVMAVTGTPQEIARVRFENVTICGPTVAIDQPANSVAVVGGGWMKMPSSTSLAGADVAGKSEITIHWQTRMKFLGERRWAEFVGQVQAVQAPAEGTVLAAITRSSVACHELNVTFDKPIYFNQMNREKKEKESDPKVETVVCTPASEDGDGNAASRLVLYLEETVDRATKKTLKAQQIESKLLEVRVMPEKSLVAATGPGTTRILQLGSKENKPGEPAKANAKSEQEMKLTHVRFNGRLDITDQKGIFQKAVFRDAVRVAQVPTENLHQAVDETANPPARSMFLKCNDTFTVSQYRSKTPGGEDTRSMEAVDGAEVKTDDYIGIGHTIEFDGVLVILKGFKDGQATLYRRQRTTTDQDYKSGNPLIYNTKTGQISGAQSSGGQFTTPKR